MSTKPNTKKPRPFSLLNPWHYRNSKAFPNWPNWLTTKWVFSQISTIQTLSGLLRCYKLPHIITLSTNFATEALSKTRSRWTRWSIKFRPFRTLSNWWAPLVFCMKKKFYIEISNRQTFCSITVSWNWLILDFANKSNPPKWPKPWLDRRFTWRLKFSRVKSMIIVLTFGLWAWFYGKCFMDIVHTKTARFQNW